MKLSVSNLAWPMCDNDWCLRQLVEHGIEGVELAPLKAFNSWDSISESEIHLLKSHYSDIGIKVSSFQAITYNVDGISLVGTKEETDNFILHMTRVAMLLGQLGGKCAVFGSPGLRGSTEYKKESLSKLFIEINKVFAKNKLLFVLETVPSYYGCQLLNNLGETEEFFNDLNLSNVARHFDSACQYLSNDLNDVNFHDFIKKSEHLHISEVDLNNFSSPSHFNLELIPVIKKYYKGEWCVLEMSDKNYTKENFVRSISNFSKLFSL